MRLLGLVVSILVVGDLAMAQTGTIRRVKGQSAIIRFDEATKLEKGDKVTVTSEWEDQAGGNSSMGPGSRANSFAVEASLQDATAKLKSSGSSVNIDTESLELSTSYLWNKGQYEYGAGFVYTSTATTGTSVTELGFVGIGEYNFVRNEPGVTYVPCLQMSLGMANYTEKNTGSSTIDGTGLRYSFGGKLKAFPWNDSFALTASLAITGASIGLNNDVDLETSILGVGLGMQGYF